MSFKSMIRQASPIVTALLVSTNGWADQIVMKNGDKVTGSVVKKDAKTVTIKTDNFGIVTLDWEKVTSVIVDTPINVVLSDGKTVHGTIATAGENVEVTAAGAKQSVPATEIVTLRNGAEQTAYERMLKPHFRDLWIFAGNIGLAGTSGNAKTTSFITPISGSRVTNTDKTTIYFNFIKASADVNGISSPTAQAVRGGWAYNRNLKPRLFVNTFNDYEYDKFQSLDLRAVFGGGLGYIAWKAERGRLDLLGGGDYNREKFDPGKPKIPEIRNSAEAYWGDDFTYKLSSRASLYQNYRMFNNLSNSGNYRQNFDAGISAKLTKFLTWNAAFGDRFLSNPSPGRKKNDILYTTGLGFTFAK